MAGVREHSPLRVDVSPRREWDAQLLRGKIQKSLLIGIRVQCEEKMKIGRLAPDVVKDIVSKAAGNCVVGRVCHVGLLTTADEVSRLAIEDQVGDDVGASRRRSEANHKSQQRKSERATHRGGPAGDGVSKQA